ncbi:hypothetical protein D9M68_552310 [compost metagenome]
MRSGMRSWSKWVIFSRRTKSFSKAGPRKPALSECWLSLTRTPWFVVRAWPVASARTRSSRPPAAFTPGAAGPLVFPDASPSERVLAPAEESGARAAVPA